MFSSLAAWDCVFARLAEGRARRRRRHEGRGEKEKWAAKARDKGRARGVFFFCVVFFVLFFHWSGGVVFHWLARNRRAGKDKGGRSVYSSQSTEVCLDWLALALPANTTTATARHTRKASRSKASPRATPRDLLSGKGKRKENKSKRFEDDLITIIEYDNDVQEKRRKKGGEKMDE